jgi:hypothetical protein
MLDKLLRREESQRSAVKKRNGGYCVPYELGRFEKNE